MKLFFFSVLVVSLGCACSPSEPRNDALTKREVAVPDQWVGQWIGQWTGPEGTFLRLTGSNGKYEITIQNLDGPRTFQGVVLGDQVQFERDGTRENIRATNGKETGMKWLSEKLDCLTVHVGEGYCRD